MPSISREVLPMIRWLLWLLGGLLLGGIVHLATVLFLAAYRDAGRLFAPVADHAGQCVRAAARDLAGRAR